MIIRLMMQLLFLNSCSVVQTAEKTVQVHSTTKAQRLLDNVLLLLLQNSKTRISEFRLSPTGWTTFETEGTHKSVWNTRQLLKHEAELKKAFLIILNSKSSPTVLDPLLAIRHHRHLNPGILSRSLPTTIRCTFSGDTCHVSLVSTFQS